MNRPIKLLYIYSEITIKGGADKVIVEKANYFAVHGYEVVLVTEAQMGREMAFPLLPEVKHIDLNLDFNRQYTQSIFHRAYTYFSLMRLYRKKLSRVLQIEHPDIVITTLGRSLGFVANKWNSSVKIGEAHTTKDHLRSLHIMENKGGLYKIMARFMRKKMSKDVSRLDALVLLTQQDAVNWEEARRTCVIPNALPFTSERTSNLTNKRVIMVGRYNDAKGYDLLIPAWSLVHRKHPDWSLDVFGSGELHDQVVLWIQENNLENSIILHDPTDKIQDEYLNSSICVLSSRYEGFSLVILESMSCGVPVVSFDSPYGPRTIIKNGEDGLLVEYLNIEALADGICKLIEDEDLRYRFGSNAIKNIKRFSKEIVMKQWDDLFITLLGRNKTVNTNLE